MFLIYKIIPLLREGFFYYNFNFSQKTFIIKTNEIIDIKILIWLFIILISIVLLLDTVDID